MYARALASPVISHTDLLKHRYLTPLKGVGTSQRTYLPLPPVLQAVPSSPAKALLGFIFKHQAPVITRQVLASHVYILLDWLSDVSYRVYTIYLSSHVLVSQEMYTCKSEGNELEVPTVSCRYR